MEALIESRLQKLVPVIIDYLKVNKPNGGIMDIATLGAQVINYWVNQREIPISDRVAAKYHLCYLISLGFRNPIPEHIIQIVREMMINETGTSSTAKILSERISM